MTPTKLSESNPVICEEMCPRRWPTDDKPLWPILVVWTWVHINENTSVFPSIEPPLVYNAPMVCIGQDYDGSMVYMVTSGPEMGKTLFSRNHLGTPCTIH